MMKIVLKMSLMSIFTVVSPSFSPGPVGKQLQLQKVPLSVGSHVGWTARAFSSSAVVFRGQEGGVKVPLM